MKKALVIGATGMVGTQLIELLLENGTYSEIVSLVRRPSGVIHPKLTEHVIDFDQQESWGQFVEGDVLFSTLGTTIAQAKTKDEQYKVDYTYQYEVAAMAAKNGIPKYVLISSAGANHQSKVFYTKMKGALEESIKGLPFEVISVIQPGQLAGNRTQKRLGERIGLTVMQGLNKLGLFARYRPINARLVAKAMINAAQMNESATYTLDKVFELAN